MPTFRQRLLLTATVFFLFITFFSWERGLHSTSISLPNLSAPPDSAIDHIDRPDGTLPRYWSSRTPWDESENDERPSGVKTIMGLVFYGRRSTVSILDCYLKRNLKKNGGMLDGVIFVERTTDKHDLALLKDLLEDEPEYSRWEVEGSPQTRRKGDYSPAYENIEDEVMYIKIDDDIVFIEDNVIPSLIVTKATRPDIFVVSANVINQPLLSWVHWNLGAIKSYLPELSTDFTSLFRELNWRPSSLPSWAGKTDFNSSGWASPRVQKHRWLPIRGDAAYHLANHTPIASTEYDAYGPGWRRWQVAAQEHYSFLENLENNELWRYKFNMWDFQTKRMGIQIAAMMGSDINEAKPIAMDDEEHFAVTMPRRLGKRAVADGHGVAAHYSFRTQNDKGGIDSTDVLDRYRVFAKDNICAQPMHWRSSKDDHELGKKDS